MESLFSSEWAERFASQWNTNPDMVEPLAAASFDSVIAFGYTDAIHPAVLVEVRNGKIGKAGLHNAANSPAASWDLRAAPGQWAKWKKEGLGIAGLGVAVASGQLQFRSGDYRKMIRTPQLAGPFLKFFTLL
ncbi:MAG: SCP-2 sterol transfer family protein [Nitrosomonadales bacterium]|nr:MAG: SCP-2 sterol transfer family protein [Nitrosomonadales bacterium]